MWFWKQYGFQPFERAWHLEANSFLDDTIDTIDHLEFSLATRYSPRSDALYMCHSERPRNKNVAATIARGLTETRVFTHKMPTDVCMCLA